MKNLAFIMMAAGLLNGCGKHDPMIPAPTIQAANPGSQNSQTIVPPALFPNSHVDCVDANRCSPSVAMFLQKKSENSVYSCTAFIYADGVMATNDHCVQDFEVGADCSNVEIAFPTVGTFPAEKHRCGKILWRSKDHDNGSKINIDMAYFTLADQTSRPAIPISHEGLKDHQVLSIYKVDPPTSIETLQGKSNYDVCHVNQGTILFPYLDKPDSPDFVLTADRNAAGYYPCAIISGNSGSPILDTKGALRGVVHEGTYSATHSLSHSLEGLFSFALSTHPEDTPDFAIATSALCLPDAKNLKAPMPENCEIARNIPEQEAQTTEKRGALKGVLLDALNAAAESWGHERYPMFQWKMGVINDQGILTSKEYYVPIPVCSLKEGLDDKRYSGLLWGYENNHKDDLYLQKFDVSASIDQDLKLAPHVSEIVGGIFSARLKFQPQKMADGEISQIELSYIHEGIIHDSRVVVVRDSLPPCKPEVQKK